MAKKSPINLNKLPEVFVSNRDMTSAVSKAVQAGRLRKIASRLYSSNLTEAPEKIVKRNWYALLKDYFPNALISDRTALENRPAADGSVFIISAGTRDVVLPGITFKPRSGPPSAGKRPPLSGRRPIMFRSACVAGKYAPVPWTRWRGVTDAGKSGVGGTS